MADGFHNNVPMIAQTPLARNAAHRPARLRAGVKSFARRRKQTKYAGLRALS